MTLWQEYAAMRPFEDGPPHAAADWAFTGRKACQAEPFRIRFLLRQIEVQGKIMEEDLRWRMLQAKQRLRDPMGRVRLEYRLSPEPKLPQLDPVEAFLETLVYWTPSCVVCDQPAICRASERWVCLNHLNAFNTEA